MRITFMLPYASTAGGIRVAAIYAQNLAARGHEVTVVSKRRAASPRFWQRVARKLRKPRSRFVPKEATPQLDFLGDKHIVIDQFHPLDPDVIPDADVIIATWWETAYAVAMLPPSKGRPFYFVQHHEVHGHLPAHISRGSYFLPLKKITISQWLIDTMAETYGDTDVALVENSVDLDMFQAPARPQQKRLTVGLMYATNPFKGVDVSLEAIEIARQQVPDLQVVAFGARHVSADLPLPEGSIFHHQPPQAKIRDIYASCDVWLVGSRNEGFGLPLLESMACRTPVIATPTGATLGLVEEGQNGYIVPIEDAATMAARIVDIGHMTPESWTAMSDAAHTKAQSYTWAHATDKFEQALNTP